MSISSKCYVPASDIPGKIIKRSYNSNQDQFIAKNTTCTLTFLEGANVTTDSEFALPTNLTVCEAIAAANARACSYRS